MLETFVVVLILGVLLYLSISNIKVEMGNRSSICKLHRWQLCDQDGWVPEPYADDERTKNASLACRACGFVPLADPRPSSDY